VTRAEAILADVRAGLRDCDIADRHGVSRVRVGQIRRRAGLPINSKPRKAPPAPSPATWTAAQVAYLIAHAAAPVRDVAATIDRTPGAVRAMRRRLIADGRMVASRVLYADAELALLADTTLTDAEIARQTGRAASVIAHARRMRGLPGPDRRRVTQPWTAPDIETLTAMANCPAAEVAARLGRTVTAVANKRSALIREGRIPRQVTGRRPKRQE
jgi:hypothetical protein